MHFLSILDGVKSDLAKDLEASRFRLMLMPVEVGARSLVGKSAYMFLTHRFSEPGKKYKMSEAAQAASFWIWEVERS